MTDRPEGSQIDKSTGADRRENHPGLSSSNQPELSSSIQLEHSHVNQPELSSSIQQEQGPIKQPELSSSFQQEHGLINQPELSSSIQQEHGPINQPELSSSIQPEPSSSNQPEPSSARTPEQIRPFPKAAARKSTNGGRKRATTRILTDTPVKDAIQNELRVRSERKCPVKKIKLDMGPTVSKDKKAARGKTKGKFGGGSTARAKTGKQSSTKAKKGKLSNAKVKVRRPTAAESDSDEENDEEWPCLVCCEPLDTGRREDKDSVQCLVCKKWAHVACTDEDTYYICENCQSDED